MIGRPLVSVRDDANLFYLGLVSIILGATILVWSCRDYASRKGYPKWHGWLGVLSCLGLMILFLLPNRRGEDESVGT